MSKSKKVTLKLTHVEIDHLLGHLEQNGRETQTNYDWYYGNREQFEERHVRLKRMLKSARLEAYQKLGGGE